MAHAKNHRSVRRSIQRTRDVGAVALDEARQAKRSEVVRALLGVGPDGNQDRQAEGDDFPPVPSLRACGDLSGRADGMHRDGTESPNRRRREFHAPAIAAVLLASVVYRGTCPD